MSLAQQLAELDSAAPKEFDAEDGFEPIDDAQPQDAAREHYVDVGPSSLRKLADNELDPKYDAVKVSRKQLQDSDEDEAEEPGSENEDQPSGSASEGPGTPADENDDDESGEGSQESDEESAQNDDDHAQEEVDAAAASALQKTRQADIAKGKAVARQISVWDSLIDTRIRLQKSIQAVDKLPQQTQLTAALSSEDGQAALARFLDVASSLSESLFEAQEVRPEPSSQSRNERFTRPSSVQRLFELSTSTSPPPRKKRKLDIEAPTLALAAASGDLAALNAAYHPHLLSTLAKWSNKIQAVTPALFSNANANAFSKKTAPGQRGILDVLDDALARKTAAVGAADGGDGAVYDDTDFYQSLLRDVIESRGGAAGAAGALKRKKKTKKVVDTKASKGRKIRYTVHEKLQHFMVPVPNASGWHDEQIDELFASLLGKNAAAAAKPPGGETDAASPVRVEDGFRLFG